MFGVHKENGGYGSVINTSIRLAEGKYFKQLDGDDWFENKNVDEFIELLRKVDADYVVTPRWLFNESDESVKLQDYYQRFAEGKYAFDDMSFTEISPMHCSAFRTELLRQNNINITEHCFYTDLELVCFPVPYIQSVYVWHKPVYVYRVGREGQSVSKTGIRKHYKEHAKVLWHLVDIYNGFAPQQTARRQFIRRRLLMEIAAQMKYLCYLDFSRDHYEELRQFGEKLKKECPDVLEATVEYSRFVNLMVKTKYRAYYLASWLM